MECAQAWMRHLSVELNLDLLGLHGERLDPFKLLEHAD